VASSQFGAPTGPPAKLHFLPVERPLFPSIIAPVLDENDNVCQIALLSDCILSSGSRESKNCLSLDFPYLLALFFSSNAGGIAFGEFSFLLFETLLYPSFPESAVAAGKIHMMLPAFLRPVLTSTYKVHSESRRPIAPAHVLNRSTLRRSSSTSPGFDTSAEMSMAF